MKLMIASDIHGSAYYCRQMFDAMKKEQPEKLLLLGDLLYHGPRNDLPEKYDPKTVISMHNQYRDMILCVRGNCDAEVDQMVLDFPIQSDSCILFLNGRTFFASHGHIDSENQPPKLHKGDILLNGHTHIPAWREHEDFLYLNPGSVSIPKEGSPHSYMILDPLLERIKRQYLSHAEAGIRAAAQIIKKEKRLRFLWRLYWSVL